MINTEEFRDLIRDIVREELGNRSRFKIGTVASSDGRPTIIFAGENEPSEKQYSYLAGYTPFEGDRVLLARMGSTYVVLGKIDQGQEPMSGSNENGHWVRYPDGTQICWVQGYSIDGDMMASGNIYRSETSRWTFPKPFINELDISVTGTVNSYVRWFDVGGRPSTTSASVLQFGTGGGSTFTMNIMAIGKWKE